MVKKVMLYVELVLSLCLIACEGEIHREVLPQVESASFSGKITAWIVTSKNELLRTQDGGANWENIPTPVGEIKRVSFIDQRNGWAVNKHGQIWRTSNGGESWNKISKLEASGFRFNTPQQILFVDESHGWVIETFSIWRTEDGGASWEICFSQNNFSEMKGQPTAGFFVNPLTGWVCGTNGEIYSTKDGGKKWQLQIVSRGTDFRSIYFVDEQTGWISGWPNGGIFYTDNGGKKWQLQLKEASNNNFGIDSMYFVSKSEGWAVGRVWPENVGQQPTRATILHTTNGGKNWAASSLENETFCSRVYFSDYQNGWLFTRDNVYRTQDGGISWRMVLQLQPFMATSRVTAH
jgi:photosystem II stability/assembly factor-like uncharacterized protein